MHLKYSLCITFELPKDVKLVVDCLKELQTNGNNDDLDFVNYTIVDHHKVRHLPKELLFLNFLR